MKKTLMTILMVNVLLFNLSAQITIVGWDGGFFSYQDMYLGADDQYFRYPFANTGIAGNVGVTTMRTFGGVSPSTASDAYGTGNQVIFNENPMGRIPAYRVGEGWINGSGTKGWIFSFKTTGYQSLKFSGKMSGSTSLSSFLGPRDFKLQYSLNSTTWTDVPGGNIVASSATSSAINFSSLTDVPLPAATNNLSVVYLRMIMTSNTSPTGAAVTQQGMSYIDDFKVTGEIVLPVTFDKISANTKDGLLNVNWITFDEKDNKHFEIELSNDGVSFSKIGTVPSKSENGASKNSLQYGFSIAENNARMLLGSSAIALFILGLSGARRRSKFLLIFILAGVVFYSCSKNDSSIDTNSNKKLFVRIAQVDIDNTKSYSKTVNVISE